MPEFKIRIRTTRPVSKGEPLTIFYWMGHIGEHTQLRQETIRMKGFFRCECARCKDPTELGTYRSGIVCQNCRRNNVSGYFLPEDPLDIEPDAKWKCSSCRAIKLAGNISRQVEKFQERISKMHEEFGSDPEDDRFIEFCKSFITKTSGISLHPNHWVIQSAITAAGEYLMLHRQTTLSLDLSMYFIKYWKHLLSIQDVLTPGMTRAIYIIKEDAYLTLMVVPLRIGFQGFYWTTSGNKSIKILRWNLRQYSEVSLEDFVDLTVAAVK
ncbi:unnamed protein product [Allacma fusca]|uniref:Protein msta n=1 Tax=Allacma fusca TaxID=39272 RepID=A0A8J2PBK8_9HEXA|nr:unnamed protein product [Allacma fusca]